MERHPKRLRSVLAAMLGVVLASLYWLLIPHAAHSQRTDSEARKQGFSSARQADGVFGLADGKGTAHDYTEAQFTLLQDVLHNGTGFAKILSVSRLQVIQSRQQQQRALKLLKPYMSDKALQISVYDVLYMYAVRGGAPLVTDLASDPNPDAAALARRVLQDVADVSKKATAAKKSLGEQH